MKKMGVIRLVKFTPRVMVIKISKMAHFMYLLLKTEKIVWERYLSASEKFYLALLENTLDYVVLSYH